ncbi:MAG TPA: YbaK/EbsC family protein [Synergistales bacterium]|nr:YbaK/EbsC family protein [Synergistales bacterium]
MDFLLELRAMLDNSGIEYELIYHERPLRSAEEGAEYFHIPIGQTAPTLVLETPGGLKALVISGKKGRTDLQKISSALGLEDIRLASPGRILEQTGFQVGSIPMVGLHLPFILERKIFEFPFIYGGAGVPGWTLKTIPRALQELNRVEGIIEI